MRNVSRSQTCCRSVQVGLVEHERRVSSAVRFAPHLHAEGDGVSDDRGWHGAVTPWEKL